jgi:hypothetical protein
MKINYWRILSVVILAAAALVIPVDVWAGAVDTGAFNRLNQRVCKGWEEGRKIVYIIGGVAALSLGVLAFFGRFKWTTFFALVGGLFMIAIFDQILKFAGVTTGSDCGSLTTGG